MTVFQSPAAGFTSLSWQPPEGWELLEVKKRPGVHRLFTVAALTRRDNAFYRVQLESVNELVDLRVQALLDRADGKVFHACGMVNARPGSGWHPYWAVLFFDDRTGGKIAVRSDTVEFLQQ